MKNKRNSFTALCEYASNNNWCWKIICTTCGHSGFRVAFSKMIRDHHPDEDCFWPNGKDNSSLSREIKEYNDFPNHPPFHNATINNQVKLSLIVADAKISDIQKAANFPDWLGYIGLVLHHCQCRKATEIISASFVSQFNEILKENKYFHGSWKEKDYLLTIKDLAEIECEIGKIRS